MKKLCSILIACIPFVGFAQIADSAKREVKLQGSINFRDIGGYKTKDGGDNFLTIREIKIGEELTVNYDTYDDRKEDFRIQEVKPT